MSVARIALEQLMGLAGSETPGYVTLEAGVPALATRFYAEEAAGAALAATGALAAELWRMRSGEYQTVRVSTREAAAALNGYAHMRFTDPSRAPGLKRGGLDARGAMGFFPSRDGRVVFLHSSFPGSAAKLHRLLGSPVDRAEAARTVLKWNALALEDAIAAAGVCGAMVRTPQEWDASEQGRVLASRPVVEVTQIGDSPPEPLPAGSRSVLAGVRVLDLTRVLAGPTCARTLAQYGADVLYIASPNLPAVELFVCDTNHGKLSAWLDLTQVADRARLLQLVKTCDVFSQGYRTGALDRIGFGALQLAAARPGIVYVSINAYGHEGPWRTRPGWEQLAQTVSGMAHVHGSYANPDGNPQLQPGAVTDYTTGFLAALGSLIALHRRALHGGSYLVRVSLAQTGMWIRRLGLADSERLATIQPLQPGEIDAFCVDSTTGWGGLRHLRPPVQLSASPTRWERPLVPLGTHAPTWPADAAD